ncbi:hypothetical protein SprV_1002909900 [Sparganum proliferum]
MGLFGHMRIHESGIDCSPETPTTSNTSTAPSPTLHPSPVAHLTITTTTESAADDTTPPTSHVHTVHAHSPHASAWSVTCESIAQRLANQCLEHQPILIRLASTAHTAPALSVIAWACSAIYASTRAGLTAVPKHRPHPTHPPRPAPPSIHRPTHTSPLPPPPSPLQMTRHRRLLMSTLSTHIHLTHRPGRSLANPSHRDWRTSAWSINLYLPRSTNLPTLSTHFQAPHGPVRPHAHPR